MTSRRLLAIAAAVVASLTAASSAAPAQSPQRRVIEITAERFEFWPSEITVGQDEPVELHITSDDTMHGFRIVGGGLNVTIPKRGKGPVVVPFTASTSGRFTFECSHMCGAGHNFMRGTLIVRPAGATE
jgi:cytochrome c oxidase subunit II